MKLSKVSRQKEYRNSHAQRQERGGKKSENKTKTNHHPCPPSPPPHPRTHGRNIRKETQERTESWKLKKKRVTCPKLPGSQSWREPQLRQGPGSGQCKIILREHFQNRKRKRRIQYKNARIMKNIGEEQKLLI